GAIPGRPGSLRGSTGLLLFHRLPCGLGLFTRADDLLDEFQDARRSAANRARRGRGGGAPGPARAGAGGFRPKAEDGRAVSAQGAMALGLLQPGQAGAEAPGAVSAGSMTTISSTRTWGCPQVGQTGGSAGSGSGSPALIRAVMNMRGQSSGRRRGR